MPRSARLRPVQICKPRNASSVFGLSKEKYSTSGATDLEFFARPAHIMSVFLSHSTSI
jgi:hypothetical protein